MVGRTYTHLGKSGSGQKNVKQDKDGHWHLEEQLWAFMIKVSVVLHAV